MRTPSFPCEGGIGRQSEQAEANVPALRGGGISASTLAASAVAVLGTGGRSNIKLIPRRAGAVGRAGSVGITPRCGPSHERERWTDMRKAPLLAVTLVLSAL